MLWLWPIGMGGRMPVGGDVTQFSIGLMAVLARSIRAGRLPIWNDLWGYGFPGLAESQMGVYYPPHWLLYGLLPLEAAYTASLVAHTFWAGLGAFWAARKFGVSALGSALAGFSWAGCGFFVIHIPHQWAYTTGSWMPWAWGLAWVLASGRGTRRTPLLLALVLTLQVLPGHFQLAFYTEVGIVLLSLAAAAEPVLRRQGSLRGVAGLGLALLAAAPLGAMQLVPTWRLAQLAAARRDYEYLSGFAATPVHLVSYVAPGLFHISPLWRPIAWDPFRTSPEEHLAYIGLVPLFLALGALVCEVRHEPATRVLGLLALATLVLSLGPWIPGFKYLIEVPGFSFFRSPARWSLATQLALCILAGRGFDALRTWLRPGWAVARFVVVAMLAPAVCIATIELALASTERPGWPVMVDVFTEVARMIPGPNPRWPDPEAPDFVRWMEEARRLQNDPQWVRPALARQGMRSIPSFGLSFRNERRAIYGRELGGTATLLVTLLALSTLSHRRRLLEVAFIGLTAIDIFCVSRHRLFDLGPVRPLTVQSPVLALLAREPRGTRALSPAKNLPMVAGAASLEAYRTLDLPILESLTARASFPPLYPGHNPGTVAALRVTGTSLSIYDPLWSGALEHSKAPLELPGWTAHKQLHDPALAGWLHGTDLVAQEGPEAATFTVWRPTPHAAHAWRVPLTQRGLPAILDPRQAELEQVDGVLKSARPLDLRAQTPERLEVDVEAGGPAAVIVAQLSDPQWQARWIDPGRGEQQAPVRPVFTDRSGYGWQAVDVPGPGRWTLRLEYVARDVQAGLIISGVSFLVLAGLAILLRPERPRLKAVPS
jgi:hypothetical protein